MALVTGLAGCNEVQSALAPAGPQADAILRIGWIMTAAAAAVFALTLGLTAWALLAPRHRRAWLADRRVVLWAGILFPVAVLSALLVYGLALAGALVRPPTSPPLRVAVVGEQWWWRVRYLGEDGRAQAVTANEIRIPAGRPVEFVLTAADVIHSFWAPNLAGKLDMIPGRENRLIVSAERTGVYRGQCAEYCGGPHALMAFDVVVLEPPEFDAWVARQAGPAVEPADSLRRRGQAVFHQSGCGACHTIRGTAAAGVVGPDLTHVGGRLSLAAGTLANDAGTLAAWIRHSQHIKPGNLMPPFQVLAAEDLAALAAYLESLE